MEFDTEEAEKAYKTIVGSEGLGFYEIISRPQDYQDAVLESEELSPGDMGKDDQALRALEVLEDAGLLSKNGNFRNYDVDSYDDQVVEEVFGKIEEKREHLV